jgi:hypothetical protein
MKTRNVVSGNKIAESMSREGGSMAVAKITGQGLIAIACSVALLWGCLLGERWMWRSASSRRNRILHQIEEMQHRLHPSPVTPTPSTRHYPMITVA